MHVGPNQLPQVVEVGLDVGDEAGVEIDALEFCLEAALATLPFTGAKPVITRLTGDVLRLSGMSMCDNDEHGETKLRDFDSPPR